MAKKRICTICGKQYEYCGHCPNKNKIEPWRNIFCSENCKETFHIYDSFLTGKLSALEARNKLELIGVVPGKVAENHNLVMSKIFNDSGKVIAVSTVETPVTEEDKIIEAITPVSEVKIGDPAVVEPPKVVEEKKPQKTFRPKPKFVNDKKD